MDIVERKRELRKTAVMRREAIPADERARRSAAACRQLVDAVAGRAGEPPRIIVYASMGSEVDLDPFIREAYARSWKVAFPCMVKRPGASLRTFVQRPGQIMRFYFVARDAYENDTADFLSHPLRSYSPADLESDGFEPCPPDCVDVAVVPLVAFDAEGDRLGYGGGNYDALLPELRADALVVGVAFAEQQADAVPMEDHDRPLPRIISV